MKYIPFLLFFVVLSVTAQPPPGCDATNIKPSLVYTRQPTYFEPVLGGAFPVEEGANWKRWYDGGDLNRFTIQAEVVIDNRRGGITVASQCGTAAENCAGHDGRVSPNGLQVMYTVARPAAGTKAYGVRTWANLGSLTKPMEFRASIFELWVYNVLTGQRRMIANRARMGDWTSDNKILFACEQDTYAPETFAGNEYPYKSFHICSADLVGDKATNIVNRTPHAVMAANPMTASNGNHCYVLWQGFGKRMEKHTPANTWWVECAAPDWTGQMTILGAHNSPPTIKTREYLKGIVDPFQSGEGVTQFRLIRAISEIKKGWFAITNYYRKNHIGSLGIIFIWEQLKLGIEGLWIRTSKEMDYQSKILGSGQGVPSTLYAATPSGSDVDNYVRRDMKGRVMGKAGYAAASPEGEFIFTQCDGYCYEGAMPFEANRKWTGGLPTAHRKIMLAKVPRITDPFDESQAVTIACASEEYDCWDARYLVPYQTLFGQPEPIQAKPFSESRECEFHVVNARAALSAPILNGTEHDKIAFQGNYQDPATFSQNMAGLLVTKVQQWTELPRGKKGFMSEEALEIGWISPDGSLRMKVPCETPLLMTGVDKDENAIAHDLTLHSLRKGEQRCCSGCHSLDHSEEFATATSCEDQFKTTTAGKMAPGSTGTPTP